MNVYADESSAARGGSSGSTMYHIRPAVMEDAAELSARRSERKGIGDTQMPTSQLGARISISVDTVLSQPTYIAEIEKRIAGFHSLMTCSTNWKLDHLWVVPEFMRQGVGRALVQHAMGIATSGGAAAILIDADPHAEGFYVFCGAVRIGELPAPIASQPNRVCPQLILRVAVPPAET
jgi:hypothetical protein